MRTGVVNLVEQFGHDKPLRNIFWEREPGVGGPLPPLPSPTPPTPCAAFAREPEVIVAKSVKNVLLSSRCCSLAVVDFGGNKQVFSRVRRGAFSHGPVHVRWLRRPEAGPTPGPGAPPSPGPPGAPGPAAPPRPGGRPVPGAGPGLPHLLRGGVLSGMSSSSGSSGSEARKSSRDSSGAERAGGAGGASSGGAAGAFRAARPSVPSRKSSTTSAAASSAPHR